MTARLGPSVPVAAEATTGAMAKPSATKDDAANKALTDLYDFMKLPFDGKPSAYIFRDSHRRIAVFMGSGRLRMDSAPIIDRDGHTPPRR
jgi:hypothetical protein